MNRATAARSAGVVAMLGWLMGCSVGDVAPADLATLERPASPNTYLVCPSAATTAVVDREPPVYPMPAAELEQRWLEALAREPRLERRVSDAAARRHVFVQRTAVLRFPDVIQLEILQVPPDRSTVCLYSRSLYGYSDFGANRARIEDWLRRFAPEAG